LNRNRREPETRWNSPRDGASITGPALAYWPVRYGFEVSLVERAPTIRTGGYAIDIRGSAVDVVNRTGILPAAPAAHVATRQVTFVDSKGRRFGRVRPKDFSPGAGERHVELARGALTSLLFELVRTQVNHRLGDAIVSLSDRSDGVDVDFLSGVRERFDLVGATFDHARASVRAGAVFSRYLGYCFAICKLPNA
jgi:2-polyprenyl-6-methoxyphenol hydroxylase-like FAD-dependent oxidoreductase